MALKTFEIPDIGTVTVYRHRLSRSMRITLQPGGEVRVTIPAWAPYMSGVTFAKSKTDWIQRHRTHSKPELLVQGQQIGKTHRVMFRTDLDATSITTRQSGDVIIIKLPIGVEPADVAAQTAARKACVRALRDEAESLLPSRLRGLADAHGFDYRSVGVRQLKGRWGSCDQDQNITLNLYLMTLPWELIDYVLLHELTHTTVMRHGPDFWQALEQVLPHAKLFRTAIKQHRPTL